MSDAERKPPNRLQSALLGSKPAAVAVSDQADLVKVVRAVNMRRGPSSANAVIKVQSVGNLLRVASRQGNWVEIVEPETGETGWVFASFVKPAGPKPTPVAVSNQADWIEVVSAVNMRRGPSSANAVIKVQSVGNLLRVASRQGNWVEVVEPETGETGWVFTRYVKPVAPTSRRVNIAETTMR